MTPEAARLENRLREIAESATARIAAALSGHDPEFFRNLSREAQQSLWHSWRAIVLNSTTEAIQP